jgi:hypothetical protein
METKDEMINVAKRWYSDSHIADLQYVHKLVVVMRDNAVENKSQEMEELFESKGIRDHSSTAREQQQNVPAGSTFNSIVLSPELP